MAKYSHLDKLQIQKDRNQRFDFDEILEANEQYENPPTLFIRCIVDNEDYQARITEHRARIIREYNKRNKKKGRRLGQDRLMDSLREPDRDIYPGTVLMGWENNTDDKGKVVEFSEDEARLWLKALPNWLFDRLRFYCMEPVNFTNIRMSEGDEEQLSGN